MHSLDKYSGANSRIVRPKNRRVIICDWPANCANRASSIGSSKAANCVIVRLLGLSGKLNNRAKVIPGNFLGTSFNHHATLSWGEYKGRAGHMRRGRNQKHRVSPCVWIAGPGRCLQRRGKPQAARLQRAKPEARSYPAVDTFIV